MRVGETLSGVPTLLPPVSDLGCLPDPPERRLLLAQGQHVPWRRRPRAIVPFLIIVLAALPFAWIGSARIVRSQVLAIREQEFVLAAEAMGISTPRLLLRHILPGVMPIYLVGLSGQRWPGIAFWELRSP